MPRIRRRLCSATGGLVIAGALFAAWPETSTSASEALWLAPAQPPGAPSPVAVALTQLAEDKPAAALPALTKGAASPVVGPYVRVHQGRAELALDRVTAARASAAAVLASAGTPYLKERALWLEADAAEAAEDWAGVVAALDQVLALPGASAVQARFRLAAAHQQLGRTDDAVRGYERVYLDFPLSNEASDAAGELPTLSAAYKTMSAERAPAELRRAQVLFDARRLVDARRAFESVRPHVSGDERTLVQLRLAELDALQKRLPAAHTALTALSRQEGLAPALRDEAEYYALGVLRDQGKHAAYVDGVRAFAARPDATPVWVEAAMNDLGTHYILTDDDAAAARVFTEQYDRFPEGVWAPRAAWKAGWWHYTAGNYAETIRLFETAAVTHRRSDYRSGWVYWAARAYEMASRPEDALAAYDRAIADYGNSYYGREAARAQEALMAALRPAGAGPVTRVRRDVALTFTPGAPPTTASTIQALLSAQLWDDAIGEIRRAQREEGATPLLDATLAYAYRHKGELRLAISAMKWAYPQYLAAGSELLPREMRTVIFPLEYWDLIQTHAKSHDLDPFLIAALMAQESTFDAKIRSAANAWGLMQILPSTGARVARQLGIRPFSTASLTRPEINIRIGTKYFADLVRRYNGNTAAALAAYNAGENRVDRWLVERPGLERDEFIDAIPFPETQGYVKKILGTAVDYQELYRLTGSRR
ncbi:MAG: hypothetical protein AMXMBFR57_10870 [Acidimicrobiia bacterium]